MGLSNDLIFAACTLWQGHSTAEQLLVSLKAREEDGGSEPLSALLTFTGELSDAEVEEIHQLAHLVRRLREDSVYVRALLRNKLVSAGPINEALEIQQSLSYTARIGRLLQELGYLGKNHDPQVLELQKRAIAREDLLLEDEARSLFALAAPSERAFTRLLSPFTTWLESLTGDHLVSYLKITRKRTESKRFQRPTPSGSRRRTREEQLALPGYQRLDFLGRGAMGNVYKFLQLSLQRYVAIKFLKLDDADTALFLRFKREAQLAAALNHPNIVQAYDVGTCQGVPYFIMEYVDGVPLNEMVDERGPLSEKACLDVALQAVGALRHARTQGIVHRDIKPANLMLTRRGELKICDFGLAKSSFDDASLTSTGLAVGTPQYMSPEQCTAGEPVDSRSDIYSLGASLYRIATGHVPYDAETVMALMLKTCHDPFPDPRVRFPELPLSEGFVGVLKKMMEKDPSDRWNDLEELEDLLRELRSQARRAQARS